MAASLLSLLLALEHSNGAAVRPNRTCRPNAYMHWAPRGAAERIHAARRRMQKRRRVVVLDGSREPRGRVKRRIRDLRRLVPSGEAAVGLAGLFREAAGYIESLRMQVGAMQVLVNVLSGDNCDD